MLKAACGQCRTIMTMQELEQHVPLCKEDARRREAVEDQMWDSPPRNVCCQTPLFLETCSTFVCRFVGDAGQCSEGGVVHCNTHHCLTSATCHFPHGV